MNKLNLIWIIVLIFIVYSMQVYAADMASNASVFRNITAWRPIYNLTYSNGSYPVTITSASGVSYQEGIKQVGTASGFFPTATSYGLTISSVGSTTFNPAMQNFCVSAWTNTSAPGSFAQLVSRKTDSQLKNEWTIQMDNAGTVRCQYFTADTIALHASTSNSAYVSTGVWKHIACSFNITGGTLYSYLFLNGTQIAEASGAITFGSPITTNFTIGGDMGTANRLFGGIDEVFLINDSANCHSDNIKTIYQQGRQGLDYNETGAVSGAVGGGAGPNLTITAVDFYDGASINNFSVRIQNRSLGSVDFALTTGNGTILVNNVTQNLFYDIIFFSNQSYFNVTYANINISGGSLESRMWQSIFYVNLTEVISGTQILTFGATANKTGLNLSNSTGFATLKVRAGAYNITANSTPYFNASIITNISVLTNKTVTLSLGKIKLTINASITTTGDRILNMTNKLNKTNSPYQNYTNNQTTDNGFNIYYLINGTYGITFESDNYASQSVSLKLNDTDNIWNHTFKVYTTNSINFTFYDEIFGKTTTLNGTSIKVEIVSNLYSTNLSTSNGTLFIDLVTPENYRISYSADKFKKRDFFFTLINRSHNILDLYLLSLGNSTDITFQIKDESGNFLENAELKLKRYYVQESSYITVAMARTDREGKTIIDVDFDDAYYENLATYLTFSTNTKGSKIFATTITLRIDTLSDPFTKIDSVNRVTSNLSFNNLTQTFSFLFTDLDGLSRIATLEVFVGSTIVCETSTTSPSATLLCQYNTTNQTSGVHAVGYIDGSKIPIAILNIASKTLQKAKALFGSSGLFYTVLFAGTTAGLGIFSIAVSVILFLAGLIGMIFMGVSLISTTVYILIVIIGLLVVWKVRT